MKKLKIVCYTLAIILFSSALYPFIMGVRNIGILLVLALAVAAACFPLLLKLGEKYRWIKISALSLYGLGTLVLTVLSISMLSSAYLNTPPDNSQPYTIIVLGAQVRGNSPSRILKKRLDVAYDYLLKNSNATVIVSGGQGADEIYPEAQVMANYLRSLGIDGSRIIEEDASTNTKENLAFSKKLLPESSAGVIIVSDFFHQKRAAIHAKSVGLENVYALSSLTPVGFIPVYWMRDLCGVPFTWLTEILLKPS